MKSSFKIVIHNGNGYIFGEYFKPVLEDLLQENILVHFLQGDYCLTEETHFLLENFLICPGFSYQIIPTLKGFKQHKGLNNLIENLKQNDLDMLVLGSDFSPVERYLINFARSKGAIVLLLHSNIMNPTILRRYREFQLDKEPLKKTLVGGRYRKKLEAVLNKSGWLGVLPFVANSVMQRVITVPGRAKNQLDRIINSYLFPYIFSKSFFHENTFDQYGFTSGRGDVVLCYSSSEVAALKHTIPQIKNGYPVQFPFSKYRRASRNKSNNLLLLLGCYWKELPENEFQLWVEAIKQIAEKISIDEVNLRFHPRTNPSLQWPKKMIASIKQCGFRVSVIDEKKISLVDSSPDYVCIVGTVSGSLRTARSVSTGVVIGLLNASGWIDEKAWMLGEISGIHWVKEAEEIGKEKLVSFVQVSTLPTAAETIQNLLIEKLSRNIPQSTEH